MRKTPKSVFAVIIACAVSLGGCGAMENALGGLSNDHGKNQPETQTEKPESTGEQAKRATPLPKPKPLLPLRHPESPVRLDPKTLVGKDRAQLINILGAPSSVREASPATVWNYAGEGCSLDVFLYMDMATREFHALAYEVKEGKAPGSDEAAIRCVGQIRAAYEAKAKANAATQ